MIRFTVTNEDGTAVDGEWIQFPSSQSGFNEEDLGVLPANDEYGNIIPSTDTTFNELVNKEYLIKDDFDSGSKDTTLNLYHFDSTGHLLIN